MYIAAAQSMHWLKQKRGSYGRNTS